VCFAFQRGIRLTSFAATLFCLDWLNVLPSTRDKINHPHSDEEAQRETGRSFVMRKKLEKYSFRHPFLPRRPSRHRRPASQRRIQSNLLTNSERHPGSNLITLARS
jgi:hypothetical protein